MEHIGIDLGGRESQICIRSAGGDILHEGRYPTFELGATLADRPRSRIVMESCAEAFKVAGQLQRCGHVVRVVPATLVKSLGVGSRGVKTDKRDARVQSEVSCRMENLPSVHIPSESAANLRAMLTMRDLLVRSRTQFINSIRGYLRTQLLRVKGPGGTRLFVRRVRECLGANGDVPLAVERNLVILELLFDQIADANKELRAFTKGHPICRLLMTAPYVGPVTAARFVAAIDDVSRFQHAHALESYVGLTPGENSSSDRQRRTGLTKAGCAQVRGCLVQCAWGILRMAKGDPMHHWGTLIAQRRSKQVAVCAVARKLAGILYAMWRDQREYDPCRAAMAIA